MKLRFMRKTSVPEVVKSKSLLELIMSLTNSRILILVMIGTMVGEKMVQSKGMQFGVQKRWCVKVWMKVGMRVLIRR